MKKNHKSTLLTAIALMLLILPVISVAQAGFSAQQKKYFRVRAAYENNWNAVQKQLKTVDADKGYELYLRAFKAEKTLEVWIKPKGESKYRLLKEYEFCASSGLLGPKLKQGDKQIPEGFYTLDRFNPKSLYHLSLGIDYPNEADLIRNSKIADPGGDIFIHGKCVTIGCIPITDPKIEELYILAVEARNFGQKDIPVHIFPTKLTEERIEKLRKSFSEDQLKFWESLERVDRYFTKYEKLPKIRFNTSGYYFIRQ